MSEITKQVITDKYALYCGDNMSVLPMLPDGSVDLSFYSPPFFGTGYQYSSNEHDYSNCASKEEFLTQYGFMIEQVARVTKPGRISVVHCTDVMNSKTGELWDFPHEIKKVHARHGFKHRMTVSVWKEPLKVRMRTMVKSLMHKLIVEDSTECFPAMCDQLLIFKKDGENKVPVTHPVGLTYYAGETPILPAMTDKYGTYEQLKKKYEGWADPKTNKLSHIIWQRYASGVWDDIRVDHVLKYKEGTDEDDERHIHPSQLDWVFRATELYSNPGEVVLTPFMGIGTEVFAPVAMGRKAIGIELKESYFNQAIKNLAGVDKFFQQSQLGMFAPIDEAEEVLED